MPDLGFIAGVAATLLTEPGAARRWAGRARLEAVTRRQLTGDLVLSPTGAPALRRAILRMARADAAYADALRQLVVEAYAEPGLAPQLPDPAPDLG